MKPMHALSGWSRDPLSRLHELREARVQLKVMIEVAVEAARAQGESWQDIADALDISRQSAWERYRLRD